MKNKLRLLFCIVAALTGFMLLPQTAVAFTYPEPSNKSSGLPLAGIVLLFVLLAYLIAVIVTSWRANRANRLDKSGNATITQGRIKVSKMVEEKLLPGEKAIAEIPAGRSDFVATDKRLLRFSAGGCEALEYAKMSGISYKVPRGIYLAIRITLGLGAVILFVIAVGMWVGFFDPSTNVSISEATIISLVCIGIAGCALWGIRSIDYGYYQIESQTFDKSTIRGWRLPRRLNTRARVDGFVKAIEERIASSARPA